MAYKYYCTYCGRELKQETVLFEMQPVLTGSTEKKFQILSFRMTKEELESMILSGTPWDMGYRQCKLTLQELLLFISNKNNLNDPDIQMLTLQDIKEYTDTKRTAAPQKQTVSLYDIFKAESEEPEKPKEIESAGVRSKAIEALERAYKKNADIQYTQEDLREDLRTLRDLYSSEEEYTFKINRNTEIDNDGNEVLIGYTVRAGMPEQTSIVNVRVCPYCGEIVFEHAGTAKHRAVTFIGDQKAGKTSTILALAHYAKKAATGAMETDPIWGGSEKAPNVAYIELVSPSDRLTHDLKDYERGIAPRKTSALKRLDAYTATLRIKNSAQDRHYLLTLTDLPGELCNAQTGKIDGNKILNEFQVALACDVFVLCFDSSTADEKNVTTMIHNVCCWADQFQELRQQWNIGVGTGSKTAGLYAPVMVIFNKCPDIEHPMDLAVQPASQFNGIPLTYVFDEERRIIDNIEVYRKVGEQFNAFAGLTNAYYARLRVSPYGFAAPNELITPEGQETEKEDCFPEPKHVAELMRWLLEATGCVPVDAHYYPDPASMDRVCEYENNFSEKTQYRTLSPAGKGKNGDIREALIRCHLFENPNPIDIERLSMFDQKAVLTMQRLTSRLQRFWKVCRGKQEEAWTDTVR